MQNNNQLKIIDPNTLVPTALEMKNSGYRLVQICATRTEGGYELTYSFAKGYRLKNLRFEIAEETEIMKMCIRDRSWSAPIPCGAICSITA